MNSHRTTFGENRWVSTKEEYEQLLDRALRQVAGHPSVSGDRSTAVEPAMMVRGKRKGKTVINNFIAIARAFNRDPPHLARFIFKESAKSGTIQGERLTIQGPMSYEELKRLLSLYEKEFVRCPVCGGPDTKLVKEKRFRFLLCEACGAKSSVRKI